MIRRILVCLVCLLWAGAGGALAVQAEHGGGQGEASEPPNIFGGGLGTSLFTLAVFLVLVVVLRKWAWKPILTGLQKREEHIRRSIEDAEKAQNHAEKTLQEYKDQLARAQGEAQRIIGQGRDDAAQLAAQMKENAETIAQELRSQAGRDIAGAKEQALEELYEQTAELATNMAGKIIKKSLDAQDHRRLLQETLAELQNKQQPE